MPLPSWLGRAARNRHDHAIEQASLRWRGGRRDDSARTCRKNLIFTQVNKQAATGATALHYAAFRGHAACVRRLVDAGADVHLEAWNAPPLTPLESAISHKRTAVVRILAPLTKDLHAAKKAENAAADPKDIDLFEAVRIGDVAALQRGCVGVIDVRND